MVTSTQTSVRGVYARYCDFDNCYRQIFIILSACSAIQVCTNQFQCQVYCEILKIVIRAFHVPSLHQELVRVRCIEDLSIPERSQPDILPDILIIVSWRFISPFKFAPFESRVRCIEESSIGRLEDFQWKFHWKPFNLPLYCSGEIPSRRDLNFTLFALMCLLQSPEDRVAKCEYMII